MNALQYPDFEGVAVDAEEFDDCDSFPAILQSILFESQGHHKTIPVIRKEVGDFMNSKRVLYETMFMDAVRAEARMVFKPRNALPTSWESYVVSINNQAPFDGVALSAAAGCYNIIFSIRNTRDNTQRVVGEVAPLALACNMGYSGRRKVLLQNGALSNPSCTVLIVMSQVEREATWGAECLQKDTENEVSRVTVVETGVLNENNKEKTEMGWMPHLRGHF